MKQTTGLGRDVIDKYYTKPDIVNLCIEHIKNYIGIDESDLIIEPSAGDGAFIPGIKAIGKNYRFYDIDPENEDIIQQDFLQIDSCVFGEYSKIHVIGNPPFGRQSSAAIKFIKKSCCFCDSISFILPKSFKKNSRKSAFDLRFHLLFEIDLPEKSFLVSGIEYSVPCVFQIWEKQKTQRAKSVILQPENFAFVKKTEEHDISFRRVGVNAGNISIDTKNKSPQSHYFIKFMGVDIIEIIDKLSVILYDEDNTVGPKSISKQELISRFNQVLG